MQTHVDHQNSRLITIFRAGSFLSRAQGPDIEHHFADAMVSVGSYFRDRESAKIASGLSFKEEELIMPEFVDCPPEDRDFRKKVKEFFIRLDSKVPYGTGLILQTGLSQDNSQPVSEKNLPLEPIDYIRWKHALGHPHVAPSLEASQGNPTFQFYIFDPASTKLRQSKANQEKDEAMAFYLLLKKDATKMDMMITLLGKDPRDFTGKEHEIQDAKELFLKDQINKNAKHFKEVYDGKNFEIQYWIQTMVNMKVLKLVGQKYMDVDTEKLIGSSLEETVLFFQDDKNQEKVNMLKAKVQELKVKPAAAKPKAAAKPEETVQ